MPPSGFVEQTGPHASVQNVQFRGKEGSLQPQHQAVVGVAQVVHPFVIGDEGIKDRAQLQHAVPIGVETRKSRDFGDQHQAHLSHPDSGNQALKPQTLLAGSPGAAQVVIQHHNTGEGPAQSLGTLSQLILSARTFLMGHQLFGGRLPHVNHRRAVQILRQNGSSMIHEFLRCVGRGDDDAAIRPVVRSVRAGLLWET